MHLKPGARVSYEDSQAYAERKGGRLMTLDEAREFLNGEALYKGED